MLDAIAINPAKPAPTMGSNAVKTVTIDANTQIEPIEPFIETCQRHCLVADIKSAKTTVAAQAINKKLENGVMVQNANSIGM